MNRLAGKVAVITGAGSGIGRASAKMFVAEFEAKYGYGRVLGEALKGVLAKAKVPASELATVILPTPNPRAPQALRPITRSRRNTAKNPPTAKR